MTTIKAWQHIYANVEKEQSPNQRGGFQTLFYSRAGLSEAEVEEMEGRLLYFPSETEPVKRLFFTTGSGKGMVAQIVALPDPDQLGRKGRYLAHSLVFEPEALAAFDADPFRVWRQFSFAASVDQALALGDFQTGDIPPACLALPAEPTREMEAARAWPAGELKKLALLALRAGRLAQEREVVTLAGEPARLESILESAFLVAPTAIRPLCTFDTYFYRCNLVATYFWAIGLPEAPLSVKFALITEGAQRVQGDTPTQPETAYERWVLAMIEAGNLGEIVRQRDRAFALGEWLDDHKYDLDRLEAASSTLITDVFKVNPGPVQAGLRRRISRHLPAALAERAAAYVYRQTGETDLYRHLRQGFELPELADILYRSYAAEAFKPPPTAEIEALASLLEQVEQPDLRLFLAYWRSRREQLPRELKRAGDDLYRRFGETALELDLVQPLELLAPGKANAFLDLYLTAGVDDIVDLAKKLLEMEEPACLVRLEDAIPRLSRKALRKLEKLAAKHPETPQSFQRAVEKALAARPRKRGVAGILQTVWERLPGGGD